MKQMAAGQASQAASVGNSGVVTLYNDSHSPYVLVVRDFQVQSSINTAVYYFLTQQRIGTLQYQGVALYTGQAAPAGQIWAGLSSSFPPDSEWVYTLGTSSLLGSGWFHDFPFCVLQPGWSLAAWGTTDTTMVAGFTWQWVPPNALEHMETEISVEL